MPVGYIRTAIINGFEAMTLREIPIQHGFVADYFIYLINFLENRGYDRQAILRAADIKESDLEKGDEWIYHSMNYNAFSKHLQEMTKSRNLGFEFGASIALKAHGYIGYAAGNAATLGEAISMLAKYFRTRMTLFSLTLVEEGDYVNLQVEAQADLGEGLDFWVQAILGTLMRVSSEIFAEEQVRSLLVNTEARLAFERPEKLSEELASSLLNINFGHSINQVRIPKTLLNAPLKNPDKLVSQMAQKHCEEQLINMEPMQQGIVARVRKCIEAEKGVYPNLESVSQELNMSSRSLKRKLKAVDSSFQKILDNVRKVEAIEYLCHSEQTIDEISLRLGFSDPSNFGRAFKKWTGVSPRAYRSRAYENR